jgi:hypothetical protein
MIQQLTHNVYKYKYMEHFENISMEFEIQIDCRISNWLSDRLTSERILLETFSQGWQIFAQ